eukprot:3358526-Amphidinium_carterae.1
MSEELPLEARDNLESALPETFRPSWIVWALFPHLVTSRLVVGSAAIAKNLCYAFRQVKTPLTAVNMKGSAF